ncbi:MAG: hypothetical protein K5778_09180, partial [Bacteroidaceae bacterium]|nr:hypothetical protein [Bacteroidaceae bacterium]
MTRRNILLLCLWMTAMVSQAALTVTELKVEGLRSPLGIDTQTPRFSWQLESDQRNVVQTAYEIVV